MYNLDPIVTILPQESFASATGGNVTVTCILDGNATVQWLLNRSFAESTLVRKLTVMESMMTFGILKLTNLPKTFNRTRITCVFTLPEAAQAVNASTLLLQQG